MDDKSRLTGLFALDFPEMFQEAESEWAGGVADFGNPEAAFVIQRFPGYFDYRSAIEEWLRENLGDTIQVYRSLPADKLEDWLHNGPQGLESVTTNLSLARNWKNFAPLKGRDMRVIRVMIDPSWVVMRGKAEEDELVVDFDNVQPGDIFKSNPSPAEMAVATATARAAGAVGRRALVPRRVLEIARPGQSILDFGAGPKAMHTMMLRDAGLDVTAHEFPANVRQGVHDPDALRWQYDIVMASNVLNVQSSNAMLQETIDQLVRLKQPGGVIVANFPESPRKLPGASAERIEDYFRLRGLQPHRVGGTKQAPVWEIL